MEGLLKTLSGLMLLFLIAVQLLLASPYRDNLTDDSINGRVLKIYETTINKGVVVLDSMGEYTPNTALIVVNGEPQKLVDVFPTELVLCDGDVVEIQSKQGNTPFYVFVSSRKGKIETDLKTSTVLIKPGINRIFAIRSER